LRVRGPTGLDLKWREQIGKIRSAARRGKNAQEIAELYEVSVAMVERVLVPVDHPRLSDPVHLLRTRREPPGMTPADVQVYWLGFLMAAGHIWGQGTSLTLVITLGDRSQPEMETFMDDLATDYMRCEYCRSSVVGWQVYLRDQSLCKALFPWGVPSELHGDDATILEDLPKELATPFLRGYADGNWPAPHSAGSQRDVRFTLQGTPAILSGLNTMIQRHWSASGGRVTAQGSRAELRFAQSTACKTIRDHLDNYPSRLHRRLEARIP
jgi:hypothetical protein